MPTVYAKVPFCFSTSLLSGMVGGAVENVLSLTSWVLSLGSVRWVAASEDPRGGDLVWYCPWCFIMWGVFINESTYL